MRSCALTVNWGDLAPDNKLAINDVMNTVFPEALTRTLEMEMNIEMNMAWKIIHFSRRMEIRSYVMRSKMRFPN